MSANTWYLGFDCATKTFAFSLSRVRLDRGEIAGLRRRLDAARALLDRVRLASAKENAGRTREAVGDLKLAIASLDADVSELIRIADGETVDLAPGVPDKEFNTMEGQVRRVKLVAGYVDRRIRPAVARHVRGEPLKIVVEFQLGQNSPSRVVATALVALFADCDVAIVGPALKNKIAVNESGKYYHFTEKYANTYCANKAHAKHNFALVEELFGSGIAQSGATLRGHIADSFMQVIGHLAL